MSTLTSSVAKDTSAALLSSSVAAPDPVELGMATTTSPSLNVQQEHPATPSLFSTFMVSDSAGPSMQSLTLLELAFEDLDKLWEYGVVHMPKMSRPWPAGMYARDMARAFMLLSDSDADPQSMPGSLVAWFSFVFQGRPFKSATYQAQRVAWLKSPQSQHDWLAEQPCNRAGLWVECRHELVGWKATPDHKRGKGKHQDDGE
ncbi:hypothetical protein C8Q70DRAFT_934635 [Cubamyces menziesii]|nr:hypothetical protein C8Q70DRAFT_934635 [Cubamyces menziesii]